MQTCPFESEVKHIGLDSVISLMKGNWEMLVLEAIAKEYEATYSTILVMALGQLQESGFISNRKCGRRSVYSLTAKAKALLSSRCPLLLGIVEAERDKALNKRHQK